MKLVSVNPLVYDGPIKVGDLVKVRPMVDDPAGMLTIAIVTAVDDFLNIEVLGLDWTGIKALKRGYYQNAPKGTRVVLEQE